MRTSLILFLLFTTALQAQDRGRLNNGAAYRTDREGNQIVDYIAELEVENDALRRRIGGLENEVDTLVRAGNGALRQPLKERNIGVRNEAAQAVQLQCPLLTCGENECQTFISEIESRNQSVLDKQTNDLRQLKTEYERCNKQFQKAQAGGDQLALNQELRLQIAEKERKITQMRMSEENLRKANLDLQKKLRGASTTVSAPLPIVEKPRVVKASANKDLFRSSQTQLTQVTTDQRKALAARIKNVISLKTKRDKLYKNYASKTIRVQKQPIMTRKGKTPEQLLKNVEQISSLRVLRSYESDVSKLLSRVKADIALIQRLK